MRAACVVHGARATIAAMRSGAHVAVCAALAACACGGHRAAPSTDAVDLAIAIDGHDGAPVVVVQDGDGPWHRVECPRSGCSARITSGRYGVAAACAGELGFVMPELAFAWTPREGAAHYVLAIEQTELNDAILQHTSWVVVVTPEWLAARDGDRASYELRPIVADGWPASVALVRGRATTWRLLAQSHRWVVGDVIRADAAWSTGRSGQLVP
jgi:hypothetical protein